MYPKGEARYTLEHYQDRRGNYPVEDFLETLAERPRAKVVARLRLLQELGPNLQRPFADVLEGPIRELRVSFGRLEMRVLYFIHGNGIVVTQGFLKKTAEVPEREIALARRCRADWLAGLEERH